MNRAATRPLNLVFCSNCALASDLEYLSAACPEKLNGRNGATDSTSDHFVQVTRVWAGRVVAALSGKGEGGRRASQVETAAEDLPVLSFATASAWSEWLATHHASSRGLWLKIAKKESGS